MQITGNEVNYYFVCKRKLWLFSHQINFESESERVQIGNVIDKETYDRAHKQIMVDGVINIDFIQDWQVLHEVKKSKAIEPAAEFQLKYYLYYLKEREIPIEKGILDYPKLKERREIFLTADDEKIIEKLLNEIKTIIDMKIPPSKLKKPICKSCAYYEYCFS
ncbi:CRISPR-associated protein Cas4 [Lactobacillus selangorensis]|uniref:CRISPR-associated exonuclease Cas4 n=1 Tax=Lactobacillus selangorensis TaxID=81857 RepID=A0A0R2FKV6_9LACO|nr:CRISPR-associated protein Cas4 [Lactobacillus selangorensis]KRN29265.1 CRISPR-associated protein Cas4 [Lactobacillus selangorensis]KRN34206.1 CRISPR-associated protein Cas4 [Lactobacillus selangorensis]